MAEINLPNSPNTFPFRSLFVQRAIFRPRFAFGPNQIKDVEYLYYFHRTDTNVLSAKMQMKQRKRQSDAQSTKRMLIIEIITVSAKAEYSFRAAWSARETVMKCVCGTANSLLHDARTLRQYDIQIFRNSHHCEWKARIVFGGNFCSYCLQHNTIS